MPYFWKTMKRYICRSCGEEDTCMSYKEEDTCLAVVFLDIYKALPKLQSVHEVARR
jgi:hypothetical protein